MGVNFPSDTLEFALILKKHIKDIQATELNSILNVALNKISSYATVDSKEKAKFITDSFQHVNEVHEKYLECISFSRKDKSESIGSDKTTKPVISVKEFFENTVLGTMGSEKKMFTTTDIIAALGQKNS